MGISSGLYLPTSLSQTTTQFGNGYASPIPQTLSLSNLPSCLKMGVHARCSGLLMATAAHKVVVQEERGACEFGHERVKPSRTSKII